jgi:hypothetical protein
MLAWEDGDGENHDALMQVLYREGGSPYVEMRRWRRRFWWLLALSVLLDGWLFLLLWAKLSV